MALHIECVSVSSSWLIFKLSYLGNKGGTLEFSVFFDMTKLAFDSFLVFWHNKMFQTQWVHILELAVYSKNPESF